MIEADTLKQLEDALMAYREDQETLGPVVSIAEQALGENWTNELSNELASVLSGNPKASELLEKAEHVIHYYGALAAWEEATSYVSGKEPYTSELLQERLPVLEYWLNLFGDEGDALMAQVRGLLENAPAATTETSSEEVAQETQSDVSSQTEAGQKTPLEDNALEENLQATVATEPTMPEPIASDAYIDEESILDIKTPETQEIQSIEEKPSDVMQTEVLEETSSIVETNDETVVEDDVAAEKTVAEPIEKQVEELAPEEQATKQEDPVVFLSEQDREIPNLDILETVDEANRKDDVSENNESENVSVTEKALSELAQLHSVNNDEPIFRADPYSGLDEVEKDTTEKVKNDEPEEKAPEIQDASTADYNNASMESKNWDIAVFLRQKKLYEEATNWLASWCVRMDAQDKTEYPFYGFIVDLMYDLKDKAHNILDNQLLDEIVEKDVAGGRQAVQKVLDALDKEIEGLPDDLRLSTAERMELSAREVLGEIDMKQEKEDIGAPPDGFELMDDPYAVSTEQIISDFEKTEKEAEKRIDNLNVIYENK